MRKELSDTRHFKQGEVIFREGDAPGALYIIKAGIVEISRGVGDDKIVLAERAGGEVFGEMALVDNQPRSATATAQTDLYVFEVSEELLSQYIHELNPVIAQVFQSLVATIRDMNETQMLIANILNLRGRVG